MRHAKYARINVQTCMTINVWGELREAETGKMAGTEKSSEDRTLGKNLGPLVK